MDDDKSLIEKDMTYSPASDTETEALQDTTVPATGADDPEVDYDQVQVLPGTGGPDDVGEVELTESDREQFRSEIDGGAATSLP